jgi:ribonuclease HI
VSADFILPARTSLRRPFPDHDASPADLALATHPPAVHFDGACEPVNPGGYECGAYVLAPYPHIPGLEDGLQGARCYGKDPGTSNNQAEYRAAIDALRAVHAAGYTGPLILRGDSQLVIKQAAGEWACNGLHLQALLAELRQLAGLFEAVQFEWIPREQNAHADALSRRAYYKARRRERKAAL